jgi:hypothetical protein
MADKECKVPPSFVLSLMEQEEESIMQLLKTHNGRMSREDMYTMLASQMNIPLIDNALGRLERNGLIDFDLHYQYEDDSGDESVVDILVVLSAVLEDVD